MSGGMEDQVAGPEAWAQLQLLSGFVLSHRGIRLDLPERAQRLVALLGLRGRLRRAHAAGLLWPESTEPQAHASLRTTVWRCQKASPGLLVATQHEIALDPTVAVDVQELIRDSDLLARPGGFDGAHEPAFAWSSWSEELLPGWYDDWVVSEREQIRQLFLHALHLAAESLATQGRFGAAIQTALHGLQMDPLRESAHRLVIELHLAEGNVSEARRQYDACCRLLWSELGVRPSPLMQQLVAGSELASRT